MCNFDYKKVISDIINKYIITVVTKHSNLSILVLFLFVVPFLFKCLHSLLYRNWLFIKYKLSDEFINKKIDIVTLNQILLVIKMGGNCVLNVELPLNVLPFMNEKFVHAVQCLWGKWFRRWRWHMCTDIRDV